MAVFENLWEKSGFEWMGRKIILENLKKTVPRDCVSLLKEIEGAKQYWRVL